jgi:hypothetical protein
MKTRNSINWATAALGTTTLATARLQGPARSRKRHKKAKPSMKTIPIRLFIALALLAMPALVQAQFTYTTNADSVSITITGYTGGGGAVVIPATINGYPVTAIGVQAFFQKNGITSVTIPNSVTSIGYRAFYNCYNLTSVAIPDSVASIGDRAFELCYRLTSVTIPNGVISIGFFAFNNCTSLTDLTIPNSVTSIGGNAFIRCSSLTSVTIPGSVTNIGGGVAFTDCYRLTNITVDSASPAYNSLGGVLFDKAQATLLEFPGGLGGSYTIPNSVTRIGDGALSDCARLTSVTIPNSVTIIGVSAFSYCQALTSVIIPNSVIIIGDGAFYTCTSLTSATIPNSVTSFGGGVAFTDCYSLTNITVDAANPAYSSMNGVLFDKAQATLLQFPGGLGGSYTIPNSVTSIGQSAFYGCSGLTGVTLGDSVTSIGDYAFVSSGLTTVTIPNSVTSIGNSAFAYSGLTSVTIPNSVTSIGDEAFFSCSRLTSAYFLGSAPPDNGTVYNGDFATVYYLPGTTGWGSTFGGVPAVLWNPQATAMSVTGGHFGFTLAGPSNTVIVVEATTDLSHPLWLPVSTNTLSGSGTSAFSDPAGYPMRFYRFRSP